MDSDTDQIIEIFKGNVGELLKANWLTAWGYRLENRPVKFTLQLLVDPNPDGTYLLRAWIDFRARDILEQNADFRQESPKAFGAKPSSFARGAAATAA